MKIGDGVRTIEIDAPVSSYEQAVEGARQLTDGWQNTVHHRAAGDGDECCRTWHLRLSQGEYLIEIRSPGICRTSGSYRQLDNVICFDEQQQIGDPGIHAEQATGGPSDHSIVETVHQGEELRGRQGFGFNELYTLMWRAGVDPLPKALDVVIQRLMQDQRVERGEKGYFLKFLGRARVENELPLTAKDVA